MPWERIFLRSSTHGLVSIRQVDHDRIARPDQVARRDHDLLAPLSRAGSEDWFLEQARLEEGTESRRLPAKGGDRADHIAGRLLHHVWRRHLDVTRADRFF